MGDGLYIAASGALARLRDLDVTSNNLANVDTTGFKRDRTAFHAVLESSLPGGSSGTVPGATARAFASAESISVDFTSGPTVTTGSPLDVAIRGRGLFELETPAGPRYTRSGSFHVGSDGALVTSGGLPVMGDGGPLQAGNAAVELLGSGDLVDDKGAVLGRLRLVSFDRPELLSKEGDNLYSSPPGAAPQTLDAFELLPKSIERSNVDPVRELATLVILQRAFDAAMRTISSDDQVTRQLIEEVGR
ncbi:MAG: flagellar hook-basal body protein [Myxococcota bacterium]